MIEQPQTQTQPAGGPGHEQNDAPPLRVSGLKAGYGKRTILDGIDLEVPRREIHIVLGGSGCGKSTLLRNAVGLEKPWGGTIELFGKPLDWSQGRPPDESYERIGVLFQAGALISSLSVEENVALALRIRNPGLSNSILRELAWIKLKQVHMEEAGGKMPGELSGGMKKRAGLARALATDPELLFCDEPSAGLDPVTSRSLDDLLLELRDTLGITMLVITHELDSIKALADRVTFLSQGKVLFRGTLEEAANGPQEVQDFLERRPSDDSGKDAKPMAFHLEN